jgi:hypothetical protein
VHVYPGSDINSLMIGFVPGIFFLQTLAKWSKIDETLVFSEFYTGF